MSRRKSQKKRSAKSTQPRAYTARGPLPVAREDLTQGITLDADVELERQKRMEGVKASLLQAIAEGRAESAVDQVVVAMLELERENERLAWRVLRANRYRFGRNTEKLSREELDQLRPRREQLRRVGARPLLRECEEARHLAIQVLDDRSQAVGRHHGPPFLPVGTPVKRAVQGRGVDGSARDGLSVEQRRPCRLDHG